MRHFIIGFALLTATSAQSFEGKVNADYTVTFLGLPIANSTARATFSNGEYTSTISARAGGIGKLFAGGDLSLKAEGNLNATRLATESFSYVGNAKHQTKVSYDVANGRVANLKREPAVHGTIEPITEQHLRGVLDPSSATAIFVPGNGPLINAASCNGRAIPVFDGTLRYNISLHYMETETVDFNGYKGETIKCQVKTNMIAGYRTDKPIAKDNEKVPVYAWLVPVNKSRFLVPYRVDAHTKFGIGSLRATKMEIGY